MAVSAEVVWVEASLGKYICGRRDVAIVRFRILYDKALIRTCTVITTRMGSRTLRTSSQEVEGVGRASFTRECRNHRHNPCPPPRPSARSHRSGGGRALAVLNMAYFRRAAAVDARTRQRPPPTQKYWHPPPQQHLPLQHARVRGRRALRAREKGLVVPRISVETETG